MKVTKYIALTMLLAGATGIVSFNFAGLDKHPNVAVRTIVIDAGHGGKDPGCMSSGSNEKTVTLGVATKLGKMLKDSFPNLKVVYTRQKDTFIELHERAKIANKSDASLFVSIHVNHNKNAAANGTETYFMGLHKNDGNLEVAKRENSSILYEEDYSTSYDGFDPNSPESHIIISMLQNAYITQSSYLAGRIENHLSKRKKINKSRGVKQAGFLVLWKTSMPSVLVETGFLSNKEDRAYLVSDSGQKEIAEALFKSIKDYMSKVEKQK